MSYNRKYYLHQRVRKDGFGLTLGRTNKTIRVTPDQAVSLRSNKYIAELSSKYSYGVQFINPSFNL